jgi:hypothetical protein
VSGAKRARRGVGSRTCDTSIAKMMVIKTHTEMTPASMEHGYVMAALTNLRLPFSSESLAHTPSGMGWPWACAPKSTPVDGFTSAISMVAGFTSIQQVSWAKG